MLLTCPRFSVSCQCFLSHAAPMPGMDREKMHGSIGPALSCRACHSEQGYRDLTEKGIRDLPQGVVNQVAVRVIERAPSQPRIQRARTDSVRPLSRWRTRRLAAPFAPGSAVPGAW